MSHWMTSGKSRLRAKQSRRFAPKFERQTQSASTAAVVVNAQAHAPSRAKMNHPLLRPRVPVDGISKSYANPIFRRGIVVSVSADDNNSHSQSHQSQALQSQPQQGSTNGFNPSSGNGVGRRLRDASSRRTLKVYRSKPQSTVKSQQLQPQHRQLEPRQQRYMLPSPPPPPPQPPPFPRPPPPPFAGKKRKMAYSPNGYSPNTIAATSNRRDNYNHPINIVPPPMLPPPPPHIRKLSRLSTMDFPTISNATPDSNNDYNFACLPEQERHQQHQEVQTRFAPPPVAGHAGYPEFSNPLLSTSKQQQIYQRQRIEVVDHLSTNSEDFPFTDLPAPGTHRQLYCDNYNPQDEPDLPLDNRDPFLIDRDFSIHNNKEGSSKVAGNSEQEQGKQQQPYDLCPFDNPAQNHINHYDHYQSRHRSPLEGLLELDAGNRKCTEYTFLNNREDKAFCVGSANPVENELVATSSLPTLTSSWREQKDGHLFLDERSENINSEKEVPLSKRYQSQVHDCPLQQQERQPFAQIDNIYDNQNSDFSFCDYNQHFVYSFPNACSGRDVSMRGSLSLLATATSPKKDNSYLSLLQDDQNNERDTTDLTFSHKKRRLISDSFNDLLVPPRTLSTEQEKQQQQCYNACNSNNNNNYQHYRQQKQAKQECNKQQQPKDCNTSPFEWDSNSPKVVQGIERFKKKRTTPLASVVEPLEEVLEIVEPMQHQQCNESSTPIAMTTSIEMGKKDSSPLSSVTMSQPATVTSSTTIKQKIQQSAIALEQTLAANKEIKTAAAPVIHHDHGDGDGNAINDNNPPNAIPQLRFFRKGVEVDIGGVPLKRPELISKNSP